MLPAFIRADDAHAAGGAVDEQPEAAHLEQGQCGEGEHSVGVGVTLHEQNEAAHLEQGQCGESEHSVGAGAASCTPVFSDFFHFVRSTCAQGVYVYVHVRRTRPNQPGCHWPFMGRFPGPTCATSTPSMLKDVVRNTSTAAVRRLVAACPSPSPGAGRADQRLRV